MPHIHTVSILAVSILVQPDLDAFHRCIFVSQCQVKRMFINKSVLTLYCILIIQTPCFFVSALFGNIPFFILTTCPAYFVWHVF